MAKLEGVAGGFGVGLLAALMLAIAYRLPQTGRPRMEAATRLRGVGDG